MCFFVGLPFVVCYMFTEWCVCVLFASVVVIFDKLLLAVCIMLWINISQCLTRDLEALLS